METPIYSSTEGDPHVGIVKVPDNRVDELSRLYRPKRTTYAAVEYVDYLGMTRGDQKQNRKVTDLMKDADALVHGLLLRRSFDCTAPA